MNITPYTDTNLRSTNQDSFYYATLHTQEGTEITLVALADGMGGLQSGDRASQLLLTAVHDVCKSGDLSFTAFLERFEEVQVAVRTFGGGSTLSLLILEGTSYWIIHIGDSRVYRIPLNSDRALKLTPDDSAIADANRKGLELTPDDYLKMQGKLTKAIGHPKDHTPTLIEGTFSLGDRFLLCSDGFWHTLDLVDSQFTSIEHLVSLAKSQHEEDNITAILVETL